MVKDFGDYFNCDEDYVEVVNDDAVEDVNEDASKDVNEDANEDDVDDEIDIIRNSLCFCKNGAKGRDSKDNTVLDAHPHVRKFMYTKLYRKEKKALHQLDTDLELDFGMEFDDIVDAFKAAIEEKVDVRSIALGFSIPEVTSPYHLDAIAVGSFLAMEANILTVAACANNGPRIGTVRNTTP
nr:subtilisin-like protease sbt1.2 [Quercus suber]